MTPNPKYRLAEHVVLTDVDDEVVLLDLSSGSYFGLNAIGAEILKDLIEGIEITASKSTLADRYQQPLEQVARDVDELIEQLLEQRLLVLEDAG